MKRRHGRRLLRFVENPVRVGGDPLLGGGVEVVGAGIVFVGRRKTDRIFDVSVEYQTLVFKIV